MSTTQKNNPNQSTDGKGQKLTAVRVLDIILDGTSENAKKFGGYDSISISSSNLYSESDSETDSDSSWSEDVYQGNKSKMRKRRRKLVKYRN